MTRGRAGATRLPNRLMAEYYAQRSSAGLLITEGVTISEEADGWNESPAIYTDEMTRGWKLTTDAVHDKGGVIYGAHNEGYIKLPYCYAVIKGADWAAMVDVGYNDRDYGKYLGDLFNVQQWRPPRVVLGEIGLTPEDIKAVFITHAHFDHFGNVEAFPNADRNIDPFVDQVDPAIGCDALNAQLRMGGEETW